MVAEMDEPPDPNVRKDTLEQFKTLGVEVRLACSSSIVHWRKGRRPWKDQTY